MEWKAYLQECSRRIIDMGEDNTPILPEDAIRGGWLGYAPASSSAIRQAEKRLGVTLPPSLCAFYSASNGWRTVGCFIYEVLPVEKIDWISEADSDLYDLVGENVTPPDEEQEDENDYEQVTRVKRSLVISLANDASTWLLDPGTVNDKGDWAGGRWSAWNPGMEWIADSFEELFWDEYETYLRLRADG